MQSKIDNDITSTLRRGDKTTAEALRFLKSILINARIAAGHELGDEEIIKIIRKEIKARIEARDIYLTSHRNELAAKEEFERRLYAVYVPEELKQAKILEIIDQAAKLLERPYSFSQLMPIVMQEIGGRAEGQAVAAAVKMYLDKAI